MSKTTLRALIITLSVLLAFFVLAGLFVCRQAPAPLPPAPTPEIVEPTPSPAPEEIEVTGIRIMLESNEMPIYTRFWPEVIIQPQNATDKSYELRSDDERVVRQQGNSWIASAAGTANIIATASNGMTATVTITVTAPLLESLSFSNAEITLNQDDYYDTVLVQTPVNAVEDDQIIYTSDNEAIATVSEEGRITAVDVGTTTIVASYGEIHAEIQVTVIVPVRSIHVSMNREVFRVGETAEFRIQVEPENASNASVTTSFSGARVMPTGSNMFICEEAGEVTITFSTAGGNLTEITIIVHDLAQLANEVFRITNLERTNAGIPALGRLANLNDVAQLRAGETIIQFSHTRPDGREFETILEDYNVEYIFAGENLAAGQRGPAEAVRDWMNSPGHRRNLLHLDFGHIGIGVAMDHNGRLYWVQMFTD